MKCVQVSGSAARLSQLSLDIGRPCGVMVIIIDKKEYAI